MHKLTPAELTLIQNTLFGDFGIYRLKDGRPETLYISGNLHLACGMTKEEFLSYTRKDATGVVMPSDRHKILEAINSCAVPGHSLDARYRIMVKEKGFLWVRARGKTCGTLDGYPILLVSYAADLDNANNFKAILDNLDYKVYVCDRHSLELLYANKAAQKFARAGVDLTKHMTCHQLFMGLDKPCTDCILPRLAAGPVSREKYLEKTRLWIHVDVLPIVLGTHEAFVIYSRDITAQKKMQERYQKSLQNILDTIPDSLGTYVLNGTKNTCSEGFGGAPELIKALASKTVDGLRTNLLSMIPDAAQREQAGNIFDRDKALAAFAQGQTKLSCEYQIAIGLAEKRWVRTEISMFSNPDTGDVEGVAYAHDITNAKRKEQVYDILTRREFDLIALIHLDTGLYEPVFFGKDLPAVIRRQLPALGAYVSFDKYCRFALEHWVVQTKDNLYGRQANLEYIRTRMSQSDYYEFTYAVNMVNGTGHALYRKKQHYKLDENTVLVFESDVTESTQQQLEQIEREKGLRQTAEAANKAKTEFLSRVSHDMRTPLNGIIGMSYLAQQLELPPEARLNLQKIDTSSQFLLSIVNDILDLNKIENNKMVLHPEPITPQDYQNYLEAVIKPLCAEKNQQLLIKLDLPDDYLALQDKLATTRIAFNLLSNACKYTPNGGTISCTVTGQVLPGQKQLAKRIVISDTGIGMSEKFQKVMYEPFSQEHRVDANENRGSGLGLAIVQRLIELVHGSIKVKSKPGQGTTITLDVIYPCVPRATFDKQVKTATAHADIGKLLAGKNILCCEDHPLNQQIITALLKNKGMTVDMAVDGQVGLQKFAQSSLHHYDLILMDIRMPVLDGYAAAKALRRLDRPDAATVPIIALTANAFAADKKRSIKAGMNDHLAKPIDPQKLYELLGQFLQQK